MSSNPMKNLSTIYHLLLFCLDYNGLESLPEETFLGFLMANPNNVLTLDRNPIVCDSRVKWLKDRSTEFETRVDGADCINDVGQTVFTLT